MNFNKNIQNGRYSPAVSSRRDFNLKFPISDLVLDYDLKIGTYNFLPNTSFKTVLKRLTTEINSINTSAGIPTYGPGDEGKYLTVDDLDPNLLIWRDLPIYGVTANQIAFGIGTTLPLASSPRFTFNGTTVKIGDVTDATTENVGTHTLSHELRYTSWRGYTSVGHPSPNTQGPNIRMQFSTIDGQVAPSHRGALVQMLDIPVNSSSTSIVGHTPNNTYIGSIDFTDVDYTTPPSSVFTHGGIIAGFKYSNSSRSLRFGGSNTPTTSNLRIPTLPFTLSFEIFNNGVIQANTYGLGNREATDLTKTDSNYIARFATDGTIVEQSLTTLCTSGTYTPTVSAGSNLASSTTSVNQWMRAGNVVTVSGNIVLTPTATGLVSFNLSLPVSTNLSTADQVAGCGVSVTITDGSSLIIFGDSTTDTASLQWNTSVTTATRFYYTFTYQIL